MRQDIHRPSVIQPQDYSFVALGNTRINNMADCHAANAEHEALQAFIRKTGAKFSDHEHGGSCHICGAWFSYSVIFYHSPTNTLIRTGYDCAAKLEWADEARFRTYRTSIKDALDRQAGKAKAKAMLEALGLAPAWEIYEREYSTYSEVDDAEPTISSIVSTIVKYGHISDKQEHYIARLLARIDGREARAAEKAERDAERARKAANSLHIGTVGQRETFYLTLIKSIPLTNEWGRTYLHIFEDALENSIKWFSSSPLFHALKADEDENASYRDVEAGESIYLTATIKKHDRYQGFAQTLITRGKVVDSTVLYSLVEAVKAHASTNYEKGWDIVIETMEERDIALIIVGAKTERAAISRMKKYLAPIIDRAADIRAEIF